MTPVSAFHDTGDVRPVLAAFASTADRLARAAYETHIQPLCRRSALFACGDVFPHGAVGMILLLDGAAQTQSFSDTLRGAGLPVSLSIHTPSSCTDWRRANPRLTLSVLDRRLVAGDLSLSEEVDDALPVLLAKTSHHTAVELLRCAPRNDSPDRLEPDVQDGAGGLQDLSLLRALARLNPGLELPDGLDEAHRVFATARCFLHFRDGYDANRLDFDAQAGLAAPPFRLHMRAYFEHARAVDRGLRYAAERLEARHIGVSLRRIATGEFRVERDRTVLRAPDLFARDSGAVPRLAEFVAANGIPPSEDVLSAARRAGSSLPAVLSWKSLSRIAAAPHAAAALRTLYNAGVLSAALPEWAAADERRPARVYRAGEHALRAVEALASLLETADPVHARFAGLLAEIDDRALLCLALLFADAGIAAAQRLGAPAAQSDALTALFSGEHQAIEQFRMFTVFQYADRIAAGGDFSDAVDRLWHTYEHGKTEMLRELEIGRIADTPDHLGPAAGFVMGFPLRYLHATLPADRERHHRLYLQSRPTGVAVALEPDGDFYRATIVGRDRPYLFASFAAALSAAGLDVVKAEAFSNARGVILDTFVVADPRGLLHKDVSAADRLRESLERIGLGRLEAPPARVAGPADRKKRGLAPTVRFDSGGCDAATLVEVVAENRPGLLWSLASVFSSAACNIDVVLVDTKGNRALDVFYVARDGKKLTPELESALRDRLLAAC